MWQWIQLVSQPEFWITLMEGLGPFRFLAGILLVMIEAFFAPLPLAALVTINIMAFGFWVGYLLSYLGTCIGTILVFLLIKRLGGRRLIPWLHRQKEYERFQSWIQGKGAFPILILFSFPFTPSIVVSALAALSEVRKRDFSLAVGIGKAVMILFLSVIGYNVSDFMAKPLRSTVIIVMMFLFLFLAKKMLEKYDKSIQKRLSTMKNKQKQIAVEINEKMRYNKK